MNEIADMTPPQAYTTFTGRNLFFGSITAEDIDILDIAHALSNLCRFGGMCDEFYSVAQHSCRVAQLVSPENQLCALLHDATEAYISDVPTPLKKAIPGFYDIEENVWLAIAEKFSLPLVMPDEIHEADRKLLVKESEDLTLIELGLPDPCVQGERSYLPSEAKFRFMAMFQDLRQV